MRAQQIENILYSGIVGDAIGVPVEFKKRDSYYIDSMLDSGTWKQPKGSWSDDTSFTLPLMEILYTGGSYEQIMQKFEDYMFHGQYTPDGSVFDIGATCAKAIRNWSINHLPAVECGDPSVYANGNGSLMRLAPLGIHLVNESNLTKRLKLEREYTCLTHRHPRAIVASYIYLEIIHELLNGQDLQNTLTHLPNQLAKVLQDRPEELAELPQFNSIFKDNFSSTPRNAIKSTGYVVDTLAACIWCVLNSTNIDSSILLAVNLGDDTDTIASITATLSSCIYLEDHVSDKWKNQLRNQHLLRRIIDPFIKFETQS